jgi:hypothetical protein
MANPKPSRGGPNGGRRSFRQAEKRAAGKEPETIRTELLALERRIRKQEALIHRHQARKARTDMRDWAKARRERTHHLIELGGLVQKAGLVDLTDDDRATLLGAFLDIAGQLQGGNDTAPTDLKTRWRRAGLHAFDAEKEHVERKEQP